MNEHPPTTRDLVANLPPVARFAVEWMANWCAAWVYAEDRGWCDGFGGRECSRLTGQAWLENVPVSQCEMRLWIRDHANRPPTPNPTEGP